MLDIMDHDFKEVVTIKGVWVFEDKSGMFKVAPYFGEVPHILNTLHDAKHMFPALSKLKRSLDNIDSFIADGSYSSEDGKDWTWSADGFTGKYGMERSENAFNYTIPGYTHDNLGMYFPPRRGSESKLNLCYSHHMTYKVSRIEFIRDNTDDFWVNHLLVKGKLPKSNSSIYIKHTNS